MKKSMCVAVNAGWEHEMFVILKKRGSLASLPSEKHKEANLTE